MSKLCTYVCIYVVRSLATVVGFRSMHSNVFVRMFPNGKKLKISRSTLHLSNYYIDRSDTCDSYNSGRIMKDTSNQMMMR